MREAKRRVSLARIGVWTALAAGPAALVVACAMPRTVVAAAQPTAVAAAPVRTADPSGVAALFCDLWLRSDDAAPDSETARMAHTLAPDVALPSHTGAASAQPVQSVMAVRSERLGGGRWSVVIAAQFTVRDEDASAAEAGKAARAVQYFAVPVVAKESAGGAGAFRVTAPPARVAGPVLAASGASRFENRLPADSELVASLGEFFGAYLAGVGEVDRYLSPGTELAAVADAGYTAVRVEDVSADAEVAAGPVPEDGTSVRVQARVTALAAKAEQWPLAYELTMTARSGRWEVTALHAGADPTAEPPADDSAAAGGEEQ
ncbi:conjugal transfer protein [Streptomyces sp. NPDC014623]|uniref:conjugal transfer protein n=1 Tax=Streptomyces sp. NPDC014623 TaxID=3364875 RepID=UPI0036FC0ECE